MAMATPDAGTLAAYAKHGDVYRFYEINPVVVDIANTEFRYLEESDAEVEVVAADARLSLEREADQSFDVLAVDAFAGDSIPVHLLTVEAFKLYFHHTKPSGALAIHVTNKHLDLAPVVQRIAGTLEARALLRHNSSEDRNEIYSSSWVLVTRNQEFAERLKHLASPIWGSRPLWTDDYTNLLSVLR